MKPFGKLCAVIGALILAPPLIAIGAAVAVVAIGAASGIVLAILFVGALEAWWQPKPVNYAAGGKVTPFRAPPTWMR